MRCSELPVARQTSLLETLTAAATQLTAEEKLRPVAGPPPLLAFLRPLRPPPHLAPRAIDFAVVSGAAAGQDGPFIFTPFGASKKEEDADAPLDWVCGEVASVEVEISNPTAVPSRCVV